MEKNRVKLRQERLQKYSRILSKRYSLQLQLQNMSVMGCCDTTRRIIIKTEIDKNNPFLNLIYQKAITLHEIGHLMYTSSSAWNNEYVDKNLANIISDGRVEESMSRLFIKARLYFIYINQEKLKFDTTQVEQLEGKDKEKLLLIELIFRQAKKSTGIPPLPNNYHKYLKKKYPKDYNYLVNQTKKAVDAETEEESAKITKRIEKRLRKMLNIEQYKRLPNPQNAIENDVDNAGSQSRKKPTQSQTDKKIKKKIEQLVDKQQKQKPSKKENKEEGEKKEEENQSQQYGGEQQEQQEGDGEGQDSTSSLSKELGGDKDNIISSLGQKLEDETRREIQNESNILQQHNIEGDFSAYGSNIETGDSYYSAPISLVGLEGIANRIAHSFRIISERGHMWYHNETRGRLEMNRLTQLFNGKNQPKVFKKKKESDDGELSVVILLDSSGSMGYLKGQATKSAWIISRALEIGKFKSEVIQFRGWRTIHGIKAFNQKLIYANQSFIPRAQGGTPLLKALEGAEISLSKQPVKRKLIVVVSDGAPRNPTLCRTKIHELEKHGIPVIGINIGGYKGWNLYHDSRRILCKDINELPVKIQQVIKNILMRKN